VVFLLLFNLMLYVSRVVRLTRQENGWMMNKEQNRGGCFGYIHDQEIGDQLSRSTEHSRSKQISEAASKTKSNEAIPG